MARPVKIDYEPIVTKYKTGLYSLSQLAKEYKISKGGLSKYFKENKIVVNERAANCIRLLNNGFEELAKVHSEEILNNEFNNKLRHSETPLVREVIDIIQEANPYFAIEIQRISKKILKKANFIIENIETAGDLNQIASTIAKVNDTLQVIPKAPAVSIQNNINNKNINQQQNMDLKSIEVSIVGAENGIPEKKQ